MDMDLKKVIPMVLSGKFGDFSVKFSQDAEEVWCEKTIDYIMVVKEEIVVVTFKVFGRENVIRLSKEYYLSFLK